MASPTPLAVAWNTVRLLQEVYELRRLLRQAVSVQPSKTNVHESLFAETPSVSLQVLTEVQLGHFFIDGEFIDVIRIDWEFHFLRGDDSTRLISVLQKARNRTEMTARADEHLCADRVVHDPLRAVATNGGCGLPEQERRIRTLQQIVIELTASNAKAHRSVVGHLDRFVLADQAASKTSDRL